MKKLIALVLCISMILTLASCKKAQTQSSSASESASVSTGPYKVTDSRGKEITFDKAPEKIISLLPSNTEILYSLNLNEQIIAVSTYDNFPKDTMNKQKLETGNKINIESIIGLNPDVVFLGKMDQTEAQFNQLEDAGIKIVVTEALNIEGTYKVIEMIGKATNKNLEASTLIDEMKAEFDEIKLTIQGLDPKKVYIEISPLQYGLWTCGKGTFQDEILTLIGAENIFSDVESYKEVSEEQVISRNPEVIITTVGDAEGISDPVAEIKGRANWENIDAVKNNKVYIFNADILSRPGPRLSLAAKQVAIKIFGIPI